MEKLFENFTVTILKLNKLVQRIKQLESNKYDLKAIHIMCAYYLSENPDGLTSSELVKLTLEDKAAISRALKAMHEKNFIQYDPCKHNSLVRLTDEGKKFADFVAERSEKAVEAGSADMTDEERTFFYKSLKSIASNLQTYYASLNGGTEDDD